MKRRFRLRQSKDIKRVRQFGRSVVHPLLVLVANPSPQPGIRIGVVTNHTIGSAVVRNRTRRRIRDCASLFFQSLNGDWDVLFLARRPAASASFTDLQNALVTLLKRAGLLAEEKLPGNKLPVLADTAPVVDEVLHSDDDE